jgi:chromosome partitioning related protein ParA
MELLDRLEPGSALGATLGPVKAVIYRQDRTADARLIASGIREDFIRLKGRVSVLDTVVPHAKAYKEAALCGSRSTGTSLGRKASCRARPR